MRKQNIFKYCLCYLIEKEHRYIFNNCYISFDDDRYKPLTLVQKIRLWIYSKILFGLIKDFRQYLRWWHETKKNDYLRYTKYPE